ncbi:MAG: glycosyltransferase family 4 protein [Ruminococcaceae bacterium]|nr:glycosyltransferase family 4 protein [Oscillospiraceae bacterium]
MKILIINKFLHPNGGSETYIFRLGDYLKSVGHEVQYFGMEHEGRCVSNDLDLYTENMDFHGGSKLKKLTYPVKTIYSRDAKKKLTAVLNNFQPDVIHINNFNYQLTPSIIYASQKYRRKIKKKVNIVFTAHDYQLLCPNHMFFDMNDNICEKCLGGNFKNCAKNNCIHSSKAKSIIGTAEATLYKRLRTYKYIDTIICCSEFLKEKMDTNPLFKNKTVAIHNFIDKIDVPKCQKQDYVLYFGRFSKEKGVNLLLEAKDINFVCAGKGELEEEMNAAENITNLGFKSGYELRELIAKAKCSVYPSIWYENCPYSVMESIMLGTPVIGANIGGLPELIENERTGLLFESGNVDALKNAIEKLQDDSLADRMHKNCLTKSFISVEQYYEKLIKIYTQ